MKKFLSLILAVCLIAALALPASAAGQTVILKDLQLSVVVPEDFAVITQDMDKKDPVFEQFGLDADVLLKQFKESKIYLNAIPADGQKEIVVTMDKNTSKDFSDMKDKELKGLSSAMEKEYEKLGAKLTSYELYEHPQFKFIEMTFENPASKDHAMQFYTVHDGKAMNFTYHSYTGALTKEEEQLIRDFVDSVTLLEEPMTYHDSISDVSITVPAGWMRDGFMEDDTFQLAFMPMKDPMVSLLFSGTDVYAALAEEDQKEVKRSELNTALFTPEDAAEMLSVEPSQVKKVTYNKMDYYMASQELEAGEEDQKQVYTMYHYIGYENGWMYIFQLAEPKGSSFHKDLETILKDVEYPR